MGITGLLPFLGKSSRRANIKEYSGQTVAIDAYCWLHKGAFSCAEQLVRNQPTNVYVMYCMKFVNMLLSHNVKPILVFDGRYLPAKAETEKKRRENREANRKKGAQLLRAGQTEEGRSYLRRAVDVSHEMALNLIKECRRRNVDCIVAPYEADAQLAYLNIKNIAQVVITEDSDLLLFGCTRVMFKMDVNGNGIIIEKDRLYLSLEIRPDLFNADKFRYMCILSGCDYLPSLPGIGLTKAWKFLKRTAEENIYEALKKIPGNLNMLSLVVPDEYRDNFMEADRTFRFQLVYDPIQRRQVPLNEVENEDEIVGEKLDDEIAFQLAIGNVDPMSLKKMDDYHPDKAMSTAQQIKQQQQTRASHPSIWGGNFSSKNSTPRQQKTASSTLGICVTSSVKITKKRILEPDPVETEENLLNFYGGETKRICYLSESESEVDPTSPVKISQTSPVLTKRNPFAVKNAKAKLKKTSFGALKLFSKATASEELCESRYFSSTSILTEQTSSLEINSQSRAAETSSLRESQSSEADDTFVTCKEKFDESFSEIENTEKSVLEHSSTLENGESSPKEEKFFAEELINKSSQEENILVIDDNLIAKTNDDNVGDKGTGILSPRNIFSRVKENLQHYKTTNEGFKDTVSCEISGFFKRDSKLANSNLFNGASMITSTPLLKKPFSAPNKLGLSQPKQKKLLQGSLAKFGFQSRPKIKADEKPIS